MLWREACTSPAACHLLPTEAVQGPMAWGGAAAYVVKRHRMCLPAVLRSYALPSYAAPVPHVNPILTC